MIKNTSIFIILFFVSGCHYLSSIEKPVDPDWFYQIPLENDKAYSMKPPLGDWVVYEDVNDGRIDFIWAGHKPSSYYIFNARLVDLSMPRTNYGEKWRQQAKVALSGDFKSAISMEIDQPSHERSMEEMGAKNVYGKKVEVGRLSCLKIGYELHVGPSSDSSESGQWAGAGNYENRIRIDCPLSKNDDIWVLSFNVTIRIGDSSARLPDELQAALHPDVVEKDVLSRVQRSFDSLELYGFSQ